MCATDTENIIIVICINCDEFDACKERSLLRGIRDKHGKWWVEKAGNVAYFILFCLERKYRGIKFMLSLVEYQCVYEMIEFFTHKQITWSYIE